MKLRWERPIASMMRLTLQLVYMGAKLIIKVFYRTMEYFINISMTVIKESVRLSKWVLGFE